MADQLTAQLTAAQLAFVNAQDAMSCLAFEADRETAAELGPMPPRGKSTRSERHAWIARRIEISEALGHAAAQEAKLDAQDAMLAAFRDLLAATARTPEQRAIVAELRHHWRAATTGARRIELTDVAVSFAA